MTCVAIKVKKSSNERLLREFFTNVDSDLKVTNTLEVASPDLVDLIVVDGPSCREHKHAIHVIKERASVFIPVLFISPNQKLNQEIEHYRHLVDETITTPIQKRELESRVRMLLRAHQYSVKLQDAYFEMAEKVPEGIALVENDEIMYCNELMCQLLNEDREAVIGSEYHHLVSDGYGEAFDALFHEVEDDDREISPPLKVKYSREEDKHRWASLKVTRSRLNSTRSTFLVIATDVTDQVYKEKDLEEALHEREVLIKEVHHRVKNNMAVITGILQMQADRSEMSELQQMAFNAIARIQSMAHIHEQLYQMNQFSSIQLIPYLERLVNSIKEVFEPGDKDIAINVEGSEDITLLINQAIPLGMLVNELVTNSFKHAFVQRDVGHVTIRAETTSGVGESILRLIVEDDGRGRWDGSEDNDPQSLGMTLIKTLVKQLKAEIESNDEEGTQWVIEFEKQSVDSPSLKWAVK